MKPVRKCDECGHRKTDVKRVNDPFADQVNDEIWKRLLCDRCYQDRVDEV